MTLYDSIGTGYNLTRRADPYLLSRISAHLSPEAGEVYLDIGCGTGNYLEAMTQQGWKFYGVDPSENMLAQAKLKNTGAELVHAFAEHIPLPDHFFGGAMAILTFHHWKDPQKGLQEVNRVLKPGAKLVMFSFTPEQMRGYWLCHYFPEMMERCIPMTPEREEMEQLLLATGFSEVQTEKYVVRNDLQDHFLYSNKHFPERYLSEQIRNNASSFSAFSDPEEVERGVRKLEADLRSGKIEAIIRDYENDNGDYLFYIARK